MSNNAKRVYMLLDEQERFKNIIHAKDWITLEDDGNGYLVGVDSFQVIRVRSLPIDIGDRFGNFIVDNVNCVPINGLAYLELELV